jgi:glycosyltransferase involved in cell wall biosynthesis
LNIVFLSPIGSIGGAERVLLNLFDSVRMAFPESTRTLIQLGEGSLAEQAEQRDVAVIVESTSKEFAAVGDSQLQRSGREAIGAAAAGIALARAAPQLYSLAARVRRRIRRLRPDIVHSNGMKTHLLSRLTTPRGVPRILHLHDFFSNRPLVRRAAPLFAGSAERGIAISNAVAADVHKIVPSLPISVIHNAVDTDHFTPGVFDPSWLDRKAGLPTASPGVFRVGLVATYAEWKGHGVFLNALSNLPNCRGYIIGGPIYSTSGSQVTLDELKRTAKSFGVQNRVGFLPFQDDPCNVYRCLDVVVHASTRPEPFGLTIAEAMSVGRPVVVAAAGGATELFEDGKDAIGYSPGNPEALSNAIERLLHDTDLRHRLGAASRRTAITTFSLNRFNREIAAVFNGTLRRRRVS